MFSKIDILQTEELGERTYVWDVYSTETISQYQWQRSPVDIEMVPKGTVYPTNNNLRGKYAVWKGSNTPTGYEPAYKEYNRSDLSQCRVKFKKISADYAEITTAVSVEQYYDEEQQMNFKRWELLHAWVPYKVFLAQLKTDNNATTHIFTKEWLEENSYTYNYFFTNSTTDYVYKSKINVVFRRPVNQMFDNSPKPIDVPVGPLELKTVKVNADTLSTYYRAISLEEASALRENSSYVHPIVEMAHDTGEPYEVMGRLQGALKHGFEVKSGYTIWNQSIWTAEEYKLYQDRLIENVEAALKGYTGFGKTFKSIELSDGSIADEVFLTLGLANTNYNFKWVRKGSVWYYQIEFNLAYISPDVQRQKVSYMPNSNLPWYSYLTCDPEYSDEPQLYTLFASEWNYYLDAYCFYDFDYVSLLDITDSYGPVYGGTENATEFSTVQLDETDFTYSFNGARHYPWLYYRVGGIYDYRYMPTIHYFHFEDVGYHITFISGEERYIFYDDLSVNYTEAHTPEMFQLYFWKEIKNNTYKSGWQNETLIHKYPQLDDEIRTLYYEKYNADFPMQVGIYEDAKWYIDSIDYYPELDSVERFREGQSITHTFPQTAQFIGDYQVDLTNYAELAAVVDQTTEYEHIIGVDTSQSEIVKSFSPYSYPTDGGIENGWSYTYLGETAIENANTGNRIYSITSSNINAYPRDGVQATNTGQGIFYYHYTFKGLGRTVLETYYSDVIFNCVSRQSLGSSNSFAIGNVAGGTVEIEVLRPYVEVVQYKGNDINVCYTYNDEAGDHYYLDGQYKIREIEEIGPNRTKVVAYDNCYKLDTSAMPLLEHINRSTQVKKLFYYICAYCDIPYYGYEIIMNGDVATGNLIDIDKNTTCRELVEWIAQISGTVAVCDSQGFLTLKTLERPPRSRGSWQKQNRSLRVSKIPIVKPVGIKIETLDGQTVVGEMTEWENRVIDWTSNEIIKHNSGAPMEFRVQQVLDEFAEMDDIYSFECDIADNRYQIVCGDSWVVEGDGIEPRRGIITDKSVGGSGVSFTSSAGIESEYAPFYSKEEATINLLINEVDAFFTVLEIDGIQLVDPYSEEVLDQEDEPYQLLLESAIVVYDGKIFDLSSQWRNLVVLPEEWAEIAVGLETWEVRIKDGYLQLYNKDSIPEAFTHLTYGSSYASVSAYASEIELNQTQLLYSRNPDEKYYEYNVPYKVVFPQQIGRYIYDAWKHKNYLNQISYTVKYYDGYSICIPSEEDDLAIGSIRIEGAYPKTFTLEVQFGYPHSTNSVHFLMILGGHNKNQLTSVNDIYPPVNISDYVRYYSFSDKAGNPYKTGGNKYRIPYLADPANEPADYKQWDGQFVEPNNWWSWTYNDYNPICENWVANNVPIYDLNYDLLGFLIKKGTIISIPANSNPTVRYDLEFFSVLPDETGYKYTASEFFIKNISGNTYNTGFDVVLAPVVKNVVLIGDIAYSVAGTNTQVLYSEMPFDITNTSLIDLGTGNTITPTWTLDNDYINRCFGTMTGNLGVVINGNFDEPEEVNWDFSADLHNQLIYLYYGPRRITNFAFKFYDEGFIQSTSGTSVNWYFEPVSQTLLIGNI